MWVNCLTHTVTHTRNYAPIDPKSTGEEAFAFSPVFLLSAAYIDLRHETAHFLRGLLLHLVTHIGISGFAAYCQLMPHGYNEIRRKT